MGHEALTGRTLGGSGLWGGETLWETILGNGAGGPGVGGGRGSRKEYLTPSPGRKTLP